MDHTSNQLAEFFARLASTPILPDRGDSKAHDEEMDDWLSFFSEKVGVQQPNFARRQRAVFKEFMRVQKEIGPKLAFPHSGSGPGHVGSDSSLDDQAPPSVSRKTRAELLIYEVWSEVWDVLNNLLDGREARPMYRRPAFILVNGSVQETLFDRRRLPDYFWLLTPFYSILREKPFPFARCPTCRTIFVRVRRQRYCAPGCASRGHEAARKDTKREYMRKYMAMRRAKERAAQRKGR